MKAPEKATKYYQTKTAREIFQKRRAKSVHISKIRTFCDFCSF